MAHALPIARVELADGRTRDTDTEAWSESLHGGLSTPIKPSGYPTYRPTIGVPLQSLLIVRLANLPLPCKKDMVIRFKKDMA